MAKIKRHRGLSLSRALPIIAAAASKSSGGARATVERKRGCRLDVTRGSRAAETTLDDAAETPIEQRLQKAIDVISEDAALVELWACALSGFAQPIPAYTRTTNPRLPRTPNIVSPPSRTGPEFGLPKRP